MKVHFQKLKSNAKIPQRQTPGSSGYDIFSANEEDLLIPKGSVVFVPTGLALEIEVGFEAQIRPRSGLSTKHKILLPNSPGTIDADYRGEILVALLNAGDTDFVITKGMRIAQMVFAKVETAEFVEGSLQDSDRGQGGFGSTGD